LSKDDSSVEELIHARLRLKLEDELRKTIAEEFTRRSDELSAKMDCDVAVAHKATAEQAVSKTLELLKESRVWFFRGIGAVIAVAVLLAGVGFLNLKEQMAIQVRQKLDAWLAFETGSPTKTTMEAMRTRTILDAYIVRSIRNQEERGAFGASPPLGNDELQRLYVMMLNPKTDDGLFADAAKLVAVVREGHGVFVEDDQLASVASKVFGERDFSEMKRQILLTTWGTERALQPYFMAILKDEKRHVSWRETAFRNVSRIDSEQAREWAASNLDACKEMDLAIEYVYTLAESTSSLDQVERWLRSTAGRETPKHPIYLMNIAAAVIENLGDRPSPRALEITSTMLAKAVSTGARFEYQANSRVGYDVFISVRDGGTTHMRQLIAPDKFVGRADALTGALSRMSDLKTLTEAIEALQIGDSNKRIAEIQFDASQGGSLTLSDGAVVAGSATDGPIRLAARKAQPGTELRAYWKEKNGTYREGVVAAAATQGGRFQYSYDRDVFGLLGVRRLKQHFNT